MHFELQLDDITSHFTPHMTEEYRNFHAFFFFGYVKKIE
jgi:hypothetical protein